MPARLDHLRMLVLDGVYTWEHGRARFHRVPAPNRQRLERLLDRLIRRLLQRLSHDGWLILDPEQPWLDLERADTLDSLTAASIRYRIALGAEAGRRTLVLKKPNLAHSRPRASNDNPMSEAQFKTLKYAPSCPGRFESCRDARAWMARFMDYYVDAPHSGLAMFTPADVYLERVDHVHRVRREALDAYWRTHPSVSFRIHPLRSGRLRPSRSILRLGATPTRCSPITMYSRTGSIRWSS